jgi:hypothetical protein
LTIKTTAELFASPKRPAKARRGSEHIAARGLARCSRRLRCSDLAGPSELTERQGPGRFGQQGDRLVPAQADVDNEGAGLVGEALGALTEIRGVSTAEEFAVYC